LARPWNTPAKFWAKVQKSDNCWEWQGDKDRDGYGVISWLKRPVRVHRLAWLLLRGAIPENLCVLHHCDNPVCVNPEHLFLGTHRDNNLDMRAKGRENRNYEGFERARGSSNGNAKLEEEDIQVIKELHSSGHSLRQIGRMFGVSMFPIQQIVNGKAWNHVQ
jgi:hypothetical protein